MAVVNVQEAWSGKGGEVRQEDGRYGGGYLATASTSMRTFTVLTSLFTDDEHTVYYAAGLPAIGDAHPTEAGERCIRKRTVDHKGLLWTVACEYEGRLAPTAAPYRRSFGIEKSLEPIDRDAAGNAISNPCGEPYAGLQRGFSDLSYTVIKNLAAFPQAQYASHVDHVNNAPVTFQGTTYAAGTCLLDDLVGTRVVTGGTYYWEVGYKVKIRLDGWGKRVLCEGHWYWNGVGNAKDPANWVRAHDGAKQATGQSVKLTATGAQLPAGAADVFETFTVFPSADFSALALG